MEGRRGARPVGPPGVLRHSFADELPQARISYVGGRPTERLNSRRPSQACGGRGKARKLRRWSTSSWPNNGRKRWGLVQTGGSTSRGLFGPMLPCAASGTGGRGKGTGGAASTVGYKATRRHQVNRRRAAAVLRNRPASIWQSPMGFATPMRKPTRRLAPVSTDHILARAAQASSDCAPGGGPTE